jgi:dethiobiotin synthetase
MAFFMCEGFFITGTDTDVGKTWICLGLIEALKQQDKKVGVMKPVSAGCEKTVDGLRNEDAMLLQQQSNVTLDYDEINPYAFEPAIAPHIASETTGIRIDIETIYQHFQAIRAKSDCVIVEGAGGWRVPLNDFQTMADVARRLQLPVVLVVGMRLGCLNHALLSVESIRTADLPLAGWIANLLDPHMSRIEENIETLSRMIDAPLLGRIPHLEKLDAKRIAAQLSLPPERNTLRPGWAI